MHWFCKPSPSRRTHHLYLIEHGSVEWRNRLAFRAALRADPVTGAKYESLKRDLAREHPYDREAYTAGKDAFVAAVVRRALSRASD